MKASILFSLVLAASAPALEVHEWGTFTTLSGSTGAPLVWYLPYREPSALPDFVVRNPLLMKSMPARVRMETPVIYFYPEKTMTVAVEATYERGTITEVFPETTSMIMPGFGPATWSGTLLPPDDARALAEIPAVPDGSKGDHYAAARAVPDAWIFRHTPATRVSEDEPPKPSPPQTEKFIFYRGSGDIAPEILASVDASNHIRLVQAGEHPHLLNVALEVVDGTARWRVLPAAQKGDEPAVATPMDGSMIPIGEVEKEIVAWFLEELVAEGLTSDEAAAMVDTWDETWFREEGLRVFSILPRAWVDQVLPLTIDPKPSKLQRVFVARLELLPPHQEEALRVLLTSDSPPAAPDFQALNLGRFGHGALQRATELQSQRMASRFHELASESLSAASR